MKIEIKIPQMGESIVDCMIGNILKQSGSQVKADEEILELETQKVNQVLSAPESGKLELRVKQGDIVQIGQVIGTIDTEGKGEEAPKPKAVEKPSEKKPEPKVEKPKGNETRKKMSPLRRAIAQKLVQVKNETAMLTTFNEVDMSAVMEIREKEQKQFQEKHGVKLGFMSFFVKATVAALQEFPDINARIEGDEVVYNNEYNIAIAVSAEKGLFVPVIRGADKMSFAEIEKAIKTYAEKARNGTIAMQDMEGGTFTITNGGVFGSLLSTPILNPPQSGILGMHNIVKRPVVVNGEIVIRPMMYLALSYDHRIVDGKESIGFLVRVKELLEEPTRLVLDL